MNGTRPIERWVVIISGFLQNRGTADNGMVRLWRRMLHVVDAGTRVEFLCWDSNVDALAELIWRYRPESGPPDVRVASYSWGGMTGMNFARCMLERGLTIERMVCSDPVYRHWYLFGTWRTLLPGSFIRVPRNVLHVWPFNSVRPRHSSREES